MTTVIWVILVGPVFGGRCGAEALGLGLGLPPGPAYRFALPPGLAAKTTRCLVFDQGRPTSHLHCRDSLTLSVLRAFATSARVCLQQALFSIDEGWVPPGDRNAREHSVFVWLSMKRQGWNDSSERCDRQVKRIWSETRQRNWRKIFQNRKS